LAGGEQAAVEQFRVEQSQAVVEDVDLGHDVQTAGVVGSVPAPQELGEQWNNSPATPSKGAHVGRPFA
jgi:hypothetical protein